MQQRSSEIRVRNSGSSSWGAADECRLHAATLGNPGQKPAVPATPAEIREMLANLPQKVLDRLNVIACRVGGDFGMTVSVGRPGEGSFFDCTTCKITLDPVHILLDPDIAQFVAAHEGSHRALSRSPAELGYTDEQIKTLYSQIGYGYLQNVMEDADVNDWTAETFPGVKNSANKTYDQQFAEGGGAMTTPVTFPLFLDPGEKRVLL